MLFDDISGLSDNELSDDCDCDGVFGSLMQDEDGVPWKSPTDEFGDPPFISNDVARIYKKTSRK